MAGMHRSTGATLDGLDHIVQSMADIIGTPVGTLIGRREYGSLVPDLIDQPMTDTNILRIFAATALALSRWEDRIRLRRLSLVPGERAGAASLSIEVERKGDIANASLSRIHLPLIR
ncbi:GPW/gp25 family protein [Sphingobium abikonense]|uniref:GPW/gp25 family protein n=1 Tax=Sphingobium abikonense TaxID=86193 RepID=UPI002E86490E|nr:GPW/gp25 family protein [Pseudomonadota bacterium]